MRPPWYHRFSMGLKKALGINIFLCDRCKWNWRSSCHNPERPNVTRCREYQKRG
ncbi:MAG: hypothetical protein V1849_01470 [Chloroflexota bacterium]